MLNRYSAVEEISGFIIVRPQFYYDQYISPRPLDDCMSECSRLSFLLSFVFSLPTHFLLFTSLVSEFVLPALLVLFVAWNSGLSELFLVEVDEVRYCLGFYCAVSDPT
jgi:hypothetical protein